MKTKTITLYSFDELSDKAKQKAIENLYDLNVDYEWWENTYDDFHSMAKYFGIDVDLKKTWFTGFYQQGQGSAYTADVDVIKLVACVKGHLWKEYAPKDTLSFYDVTPNIERVCKLISKDFIDGSCYVEATNRETSIKVSFDYDIYNTNERWDQEPANVLNAINDLEILVSDVCKTLNDWFFKNLQTEYDYLTSEEAIIESIQANDYTFTEDGKLEN